MRILLHKKNILFYICVLLTIIPFFWLAPGEMDLGGDSSRLYFYDPLSYLINTGLYSIQPVGIGNVQANYYFIPFVGLLIPLKAILHSSYVLITLFNSVKLVVSFLSVYAICKELLKPYKNKLKNSLTAHEFASILAGLLYVFIPTMTYNWDKALITHNQIFLNPLIFYLFFRFVVTKRVRYMLVIFLVTLVFAPNFAWIATPTIFSFYPLSFLFLFLYVSRVIKTDIPWKSIFLAGIVLVGLHSFQILPQVINLFDPKSLINTRVFDKASIVNEGVRYFLSVLPLAKVSLRILTPSAVSFMGFFSVIVPLLVIVGLLNNHKNKGILLTSIFFLITLFLLTANITNVGVFFYQSLFYIPGFSVFRNFIGQWLVVYSFFYALLFAQAVHIIFQKFKNTPIIVFSGIFILLLTVQAWQFIDGSMVNHKLFRSDRYIAIIMDPKFESTLQDIKTLPDGKTISFPFNDYYFQSLSGTNNGTYQGPSIVSHIAGKNDFAGYTDTQPFSDEFLNAVKAKDYEMIQRMLGIFNIRYIFHNTDPNVYDKTFPNYPYEYTRQFFPGDQKGYSELVKHISAKRIYKNGPYEIHETKKEYFLPHIYSARNIIPYKHVPTTDPFKAKSFLSHNRAIQQTVFVESVVCLKLKGVCEKESIATASPTIAFNKVNPTKYIVTVKNAPKKHAYVLVFLEAYNAGWELYKLPKDAPISDSTIFQTWKLASIANNKHFEANGYANAWYISPEDTSNNTEYNLVLELKPQKYFYISLFVSGIFFLVLIVWVIKTYLSKRNLL